MDGPISRTAAGAARHRAVHQLLDGGRVFPDPVAVPILGLPPEEIVTEADASPGRRPMRAFIAVRHAYAAEVVARAAADGVRQVVVLGAGLDTTAYRPASAELGLRVVEVDLPATQRWKRQSLAAAGIAPTVPVTYVAADLSREGLTDALTAAGVDLSAGCVALLLGVLPYLDRETVAATMRAVGAWPAARLVLDYSEPPDDSGSRFEAWRAEGARRVAAAGEPWRTFLTPKECHALLGAAGFADIEDLSLAEYGPRYLGLTDPPRRPGGHVLSARSRA